MHRCARCVVGVALGLSLFSGCDSKTPGPAAGAEGKAAPEAAEATPEGKAAVDEPAAATPAQVATGSSVELAPNPSKHFDAVASHLHLGGDVFLYLSFEDFFGNAEQAMYTMLEEEEEALELAKKGTEAIRKLGLTQYEAIGVSSYRDGEMYENRMFIKTSGNEGLLGWAGDEAGPLFLFERAPADTSMAVEFELHAKKLIDLGIELGKEFEPDIKTQVEEALSEPIPSTDLKVQDLVDAADTRIMIAVKLDPEERMQLPDEDDVTIPMPHAVVVVEGFGEIAEKALTGVMDMLEKTEADGLTIYESKMPAPFLNSKPVIAKDADGRAWVATSMDDLKAWQNPSSKLVDSDEFKALAKNLPTEGNMVTYLSPATTELAKREVATLVKATGDDDEIKLAESLIDLMVPNGGILQVMAVHPDGHLVASRSPQSYRTVPFASAWVVGGVVAGAGMYLLTGLAVEPTAIVSAPPEAPPED